MHLKVIAVLASLLAAGVVVGRRVGLHAAWRRLAGRGAGVSARRAPQPVREPWRCACGHGFLVAGRDRHRIYWLEGAAEAEPLLTDRCPSCDRLLPAEHEAGVAVG